MVPKNSVIETATATPVLPIPTNCTILEGIVVNNSNNSGNLNEGKVSGGLDQLPQIKEASLGDFIKLVDDMGFGLDPHSDHDADDVHKVVYMAALMKNLRAVQMEHARMRDQLNKARMRGEYLRQHEVHQEHRTSK